MTRYWILVAVIVLAGTWLRIWKLGEVPVSLYWDEIAMLADARSIAQTGFDMSGNPWLQSIYPSYGDFKLAPYIIFSAPFASLPLAPAVQIRALSVIVGLATMLVGFLLAQRLCSSFPPHARRGFALATLFTIAFSPWAIGFSRTGFEGHLAQLFLATSVLLVLDEKKRWYKLVLAGIFGSLAASTYYAALYVWPAVILTAICCYWFETRVVRSFSLQKVKSTAVSLIILFFSFSLGMMPLLTSDFFDDMQNIRLGSTSVLDPVPFVALSRESREIADNSFTAKVLYTAKYYQLRQAIIQFSENISPRFLYISGDDNRRHSSGYGGLFATICLPILLFGIFMSFRQHKRAGFLLLIWWFVATIPASIPTNVPHALRSLNALMPISILIGLGWTHLFLFSSKWLRSLAYISVFIFLVQTTAIMYHYFVVYPKLSASSWQDGYHQLVEFALPYSKAGSQIWIDHSDKIFLWYIVYADVSADVVQSAFKLKPFAPESFGSVHFRPFSGKLDRLEGPTVLIMDTDKMTDLLQKNQATPSAVVAIPGTFDQSNMQMAVFTADQQ